MDNNCLFCKIVSGEIPSEKVAENDDFLAFLDISPVNPGHTLVIPKSHHQNIYEIPDDLISKMAPFVKRVAIGVKEATKAGGINVYMNNEPSAGQVVFHAHIHVIPRYQNDGYELWHGKPYPNDETLKEIASKIREFI